ncbi:hypothetical protein C8Q77DRAFT_1073628 [Trametes polyzona]|nr:hypothetical protein C8Q77DRAFT_1073628 [Trametes polyzona]
MESLNLNNLASSLPSSSYAKAENELTNNFRAAALSLTTLFRSSKTASKRAYNAGYAAACHDLLNMIQQGVSTDVDAGREVTIGRIMDYIEARLEAIKAREEEEDEEEERAAARPGPSAAAAAPAQAAAASKSKPASPTLPPARAREAPPAPVAAPPTPYTPSTMDPTSRPYVTAAALASPSPAVAAAAAVGPLRPMSAPVPAFSRASKARLLPTMSLNPKDQLSSVPIPASGAMVPFSFEPPAVTDVTVPTMDTQALAMPMKRRREPEGSVQVAETAGAGTSRRRTRSWRGSGADSHGGQQQSPQQQQQQQTNEAMDVEEEGPQRKRVARR